VVGRVQCTQCSPHPTRFTKPHPRFSGYVSRPTTPMIETHQMANICCATSALVVPSYTIAISVMLTALAIANPLSH